MDSPSTQSGPESEVDDCPVCLAPLSTGNQLLSAVCKHGVHVHCAMGNPVALRFFMRNNICSICRKGPFLAEATLQSTAEWMHGSVGVSPTFTASAPHTPRWHRTPSPYPPDAFHIAGEWGPDEQDEFEEYQAALAAERRGVDHARGSPAVSISEEGFLGYAEEVYGGTDGEGLDESEFVDEWAEQEQLMAEEYLESMGARHRSVTSLVELADTESARFSDVRSLEGFDEEDGPSNQVTMQAPRSTTSEQSLTDSEIRLQIFRDTEQLRQSGEQRAWEFDPWQHSDGWGTDPPPPLRLPQARSARSRLRAYSFSLDSELPEPASTSRSLPARSRELAYLSGSPARSTPQHPWGEEPLQPGSPVRSTSEPHWDEEPVEAGSPTEYSPEPYWNEELEYADTPVGTPELSTPQRQWEDEQLECGSPMGAPSEQDWGDPEPEPFWDPELLSSGSPVEAWDGRSEDYDEEPY